MIRPHYLALLLLLTAGGAKAQSPTDTVAVRAAVLDYVEALYRAEPERIARSVHPELRKLGFWRQAPGAPYQPALMTYDELHGLAERWNAGNRRGLSAETVQGITVLDVLDQTATAKLVADWGVDYLHLAKYDEGWQIVNVLWQSPPPAEGPGPFTPEDFRSLRWLEGAWRGGGSDGDAFYERYEFESDTVLTITYFADSSLAHPTGTGWVVFRDGEILHEAGPARWAATRIDPSGIHFAPVERARNRFTWSPISSDEWTATLHAPGGASPEQVVYRMERIRR